MVINEDFVLFWDGIYSNWNSARFTDPITNITFEHTEKAFMWYKADFFKDLGSRATIEKETDPSVVKKLGRLVQPYDQTQWDCVKVGFMVYVNYLKFSQDLTLKQIILDTGDRVLVECSPYDKVWGIGLRENDPSAMIRDRWLGQNLLGFSLMKVRKILKQ
jgi:ribA/ribD-fused uncharacterized protein